MIQALRDFGTSIGRRGEILRELWNFLWLRKAYWLIPLVLVLGAVAFLFFVASQPPVTPFIYTLF